MKYFFGLSFICFFHFLYFSGNALGTDTPPEMPESVKAYLNGETEYHHQAGLVIESTSSRHFKSLEDSDLWILTPIQQKEYDDLPLQYSVNTSETLLYLLNNSLSEDSFTSFVIVLPTREFTIVPTRLETIGPQSAVITGHILGDDYSMVCITYTGLLYTLVIYPGDSTGIKISGLLTENMGTIQHVN